MGQAKPSGEASFFGGEEHLYHAFFRASMGGVLFADAQGGILDANAEACRLLGRKREELLAPGGGDIFDPSDRRLAAAREEQREKGSFRGPLRVLRGAAGSAGSFEASVTVAAYVDGFDEDRLVIAVADREGSLPGPGIVESTEETFRSLACHVGDAVVIFEIDGSLRYVSPSIKRVLGYAPGELVGTVALDMLHPEDLEMVVANSVEIWDSPGVAPLFVFRCRRKDGSWVHLELAMNNFLNDPNLNAVVAILRDVTERVRAEEEVRRLNEELERRVAERTAELEASVVRLKENERIMNATFEGMASDLAHLSPDGPYLRVNRRFCEITGYSSEELLSKTPHEITHPEDVSKDEEHRQRLLAGALSDYSVEKRYLRKDGSYVWVSINVSPLYEGGDFTGKPNYFIVVAEDIDTRKKAELVLGSLTLREKEVLLLTARGRTNPQIQEDLKIGLGTVKHHLRNIVEKLEVEDRTQAAARAAELGLLPVSADAAR